LHTVAGEKLHDYDLEICNYVLDNIRQYLRKPRYAARIEQQLYPERLRDYVIDRLSITDQEWLLNEDELNELQSTFERLGRMWCKWRPYEQLHGRYICTVKEVAKELTQQQAEDWSRVCTKFAKRLESRPCYLAEGIEIVGEWLWELRKLLRAMEATDFLPYPEGQWPTPTNPTPPAPTVVPVPTLRGREAIDIERMREVIRADPNSKDWKPQILIQRAKINMKNGRRALRWLEAQGEYNGFARAAPDRPRADPRQEQ
jgi:hypothetical protein